VRLSDIIQRSGHSTHPRYLRLVTSIEETHASPGVSQFFRYSACDEDAAAFVVNRLLARFLGEVTKSIDEGTPFEVTDSALEPVGLPMSPLVLLQLVGPAIAQHVTETMHAAFPERFYLSEILGRVVAVGQTAIYLPQGGQPRVDPEVAAMFEPGDSPSTADQVRERRRCPLSRGRPGSLAEGVVAEAQDIDLCMITGAGWPFHLGGITPYLGRSGRPLFEGDRHEPRRSASAMRWARTTFPSRSR
jgi:hypothetical protein